MMMFKMRHFGIVIIILFVALSTAACFGISLVTQLPQPTIPITIQPPTETTFPISTTTIIPSSTASAIPISTDIPVTSTATLVSTEIPPISGQVNILGINGFKDEADYWYFYGLVRNDTNRTIYDLQIEIMLMDSAGVEIYSYTTYPILYYLAPGETSPFSDFSIEPFPDGSSMKATVVSSESIEEINRANLNFRGVTIWADENNDVYLAGEVFNGNASPVEINAIAGSLTDETGNLVTASYAYPFLGYVDSNNSSPFVMMFKAPSGQAGTLTNYTLYSDALITNPAPKYDILISEKQNKYQDINGKMHLVGSVTNNATKPMNFQLMAGIYDENGNCLDANSVQFPIPLNPGETIPYDFIMWGAMDYVPAAYEAAIQSKIFINWVSTNEAYSKSYTIITKDNTKTYEGNVGKFNGIVVNNSGYDLSTVVVLVTLYDKISGELIATNYAYVTESMINNASGTYEVYLYPSDDIDPTNFDTVIIAFGQ